MKETSPALPHAARAAIAGSEYSNQYYLKGSIGLSCGFNLLSWYRDSFTLAQNPPLRKLACPSPPGPPSSWFDRTKFDCQILGYGSCQYTGIGTVGVSFRRKCSNFLREERVFELRRPALPCLVESRRESQSTYSRTIGN